GLLDKTTAVDIRLYGSLAATGVGHGTVPAVLVGLTGRRPEEVTPEEMAARMADLRSRGRLDLAGRVGVPMSEQDVVRHPLTVLPGHPNGMVLAARGPAGGGPYAQACDSTRGRVGASLDGL